MATEPKIVVTSHRGFDFRKHEVGDEIIGRTSEYGSGSPVSLCRDYLRAIALAKGAVGVINFDFKVSEDGRVYCHGSPLLRRSENELTP